MNVEELIERLEEMDPNAEVRFAAQPHYPMEYSIGQVVEVDTAELPHEEIDEIREMVRSSVDEGELDISELGVTIEELIEKRKQERNEQEQRRNWGGEGLGPVVYISEETQVGYLNSRASEELGWR
jgi:hypothetical protein